MEAGIISKDHFSDHMTNKISICDADEICIIDDSSIPRKLSQRACEFALPSIPIKTFEDVDSAITYLKSARQKKRTIFLDLYMPEKDGWDFLKMYNPEWYENIYLLTTSEDQNDIDKSKQFSSVTDYLIKPLSIQKIKTL
jgi:response regulator of citrate/malate metabolism